MKSDFIEIVGQRINGFVIKEEPSREPRTQLFLLFKNEKYFEFYFPESMIFHTELFDSTANPAGKLILGVGNAGNIRTGLENGSHSHYPAYYCRALICLRSFRAGGERHFNLSLLHMFLGRTITGVLNHESKHGFHRLWILFDDATFLEIEDQHLYIRSCSRIDKGGIEAVRDYMAGHPTIYEDLDEIEPSSSTVQ